MFICNPSVSVNNVFFSDILRTIEPKKYNLSEFKISWVCHILHPFLIITHSGHIKK